MINITVNGYVYPITFSTFPGGEEHVNIKENNTFPVDPTEVVVTSSIHSSTELVRTLLVVDAVRQMRWGKYTLALDLGYLPYARQDRVCARGEAFSLKVICNLINGLNLDEVRVTDCHSEVGLALLDNVVHTTQATAISRNKEMHNILSSDTDYLIIPDAGASKKSQELADLYSLKTIQCSKTRDPYTGRIQVEMLIPPMAYNTNLVVVDDICDGGGTFMAIAEALHPSMTLYLIVTHGIFSKGKKDLLTEYEKVLAVYDDSGYEKPND